MIDVEARLPVMLLLLKISLSPEKCDSLAAVVEDPRNELELHKCAPNTTATLPPYTCSELVSCGQGQQREVVRTNAPFDEPPEASKVQSMAN